MIDDWFAIRVTPTRVGSLGSLLSPQAGRFFPGASAWAYLQWHTLGAPGDMFGPNAWDLVRVSVFIVGVGLFAYLLGRFGDAQNPTRAAVVLALIAPLLVVTTPDIAVDFARFAPQEVLLVGCLTLGGSLLFLGMRELVMTPVRRRAGRIAACLVLGYAFWVAGVYQKEVSIAVLVWVPFIYLARRAHVNRAVAALPGSSRWVLAGICAAVLAPVAHMAVEVALITHRGHLVLNGNQVRPGTGEIQKIVRFFVTMPASTGSIVGVLLTLVVAIQVTVSLVNRRPDWLMSGLFATVLVCLIWYAQTGVYPSRYYIPSLTLVAVALSLTLTRLSVVLARRRQPAGLVAAGAVCVLVVGSALQAHRDVEHWAQDDQRGRVLVEAVARARSSGCPVVETGVDPERTLALPFLSSLVVEPVRPRLPCVRRGFVVFGPETARVVAAACPPPKRTQLGTWVLEGEQLSLVRCDRLTSGAARLLAARTFQ